MGRGKGGSGLDSADRSSKPAPPPTALPPIDTKSSKTVEPSAPPIPIAAVAEPHSAEQDVPYAVAVPRP